MQPAPLKLQIIAGARPNFMKIAPLIKAARARNAAARNGEPKLECRLIHTGQHYDAKMSDIFFEELGIPAPDINLEVGSGSHAAQTANIMSRFEPVCLQEKPDWVIVVGDVNSTMACTLVAAKLGIRVAHVEAGLRSFDRTMPEEINRIVTDSLADLLLTPSEDANENLQREGVAASRIRLVGNIMIDSLIANLDQSEQGRVLERLGLRHRGFVYVTLHRPANVDHKEPLSAIMQALAQIATRLPVVFPVHPRTRQRLADFGFANQSSLSSPGGEGPGEEAIPHQPTHPLIYQSINPPVHFLEPVGYHDSLALTRHARCVVTDSGGLQEESTFFRTPCLTLRPNTERPVTVTCGSNRLVQVEQLAPNLEQVLQGAEELGRVPPLWDGKAAERILDVLMITEN